MQNNQHREMIIQNGHTGVFDIALVLKQYLRKRSHNARLILPNGCYGQFNHLLYPFVLTITFNRLARSVSMLWPKFFS